MSILLLLFIIIIIMWTQQYTVVLVVHLLSWTRICMRSNATRAAIIHPCLATNQTNIPHIIVARDLEQRATSVS